MVDFSELLDAWARVDSTVESIVGGFNDARRLSVALRRDHICHNHGFASSADAYVRIAISAAVTLCLSTVFSLVDFNSVSFWAVEVAIVVRICGLVLNFADWREYSDWSASPKLCVMVIKASIYFK